jgi:hypothetical protein
VKSNGDGSNNVVPLEPPDQAVHAIYVEDFPEAVVATLEVINKDEWKLKIGWKLKVVMFVLFVIGMSPPFIGLSKKR